MMAVRRWDSSWCALVALVGTVAALHVVMRPNAALAVCGDHIVDVDSDEECDDGGICTGGANAGEPCSAESDCVGNGVCVDGVKNATGCAVDSDCPGGKCIHCKTFGGDGCAANCTTEADVVLNFLPGVARNGEIVSGSGAVVHGAITIPVPLHGQQILTVGKQRNGRIPGVIKADAVNLPRIPVGTAGCACVRAVAVKTCGGTLFEPDGATLSTDCTDDFTAGPSVCPADKPCSFVHGRGNSASGVIGCQGLDAVNVTYTQDCNGEPGGVPSDPVIGFSGAGGAGSAVILTSNAIGTLLGSCTGSGPAYGPDGEFCTDDDPLSSRGSPATLPATTGTASTTVFNASDTLGAENGPFQGVGSPFTCIAVENHFVEEASLAGVFTLCDQPLLGDIAVTNSFVAGPSGPALPTHTATASPTQTPTPTLTPTCAPTGTPYCSDQCVPCPTIRAGCYAAACGACIDNPHCGAHEACVQHDAGPPFGCCSCATLTPTPTPTDTASPTPSPTATLTPTLPPSPLPTSTPTLTPSPLPTSTPTLPPSPLPTSTPPLTPSSPPTFTPTVTPPSTATPTSTPVCVGDCGRDGSVTIEELVKMVNIALDNALVTGCSAGDANGDGEITIDEILKAVNHTLNGCEAQASP